MSPYLSRKWSKLLFMNPAGRNHVMLTSLKAPEFPASSLNIREGIGSFSVSRLPRKPSFHLRKKTKQCHREISRKTCSEKGTFKFKITVDNADRESTLAMVSLERASLGNGLAMIQLLTVTHIYSPSTSLPPLLSLSYCHPTYAVPTVLFIAGSGTSL